ncbi:MAG TPA: polysaccharide deacetylase family protein [Thermoanaerobaculia bacterium]|nr:polysaccharide deacetylase family protein [Thermoanaerobaculia bacterium]
MAIVEDRSAPAPALPAEAPPPRAWRPAPLLTASAGLHAAVAAALAVAPHHWRLAVAALAGNHTLIAGVGMWPRSRLLGPNLCRFSGAAARRGEVALTFDDGPDPLVTPPVLDCLERYGVRATFFCIGRRAENHPELVAEMVRRGHRVENHSYSHPHAFACYPPAAMRREVRRAQEALARAGGIRPRWFRAPAGFRGPLLERELAAAGLHLASWTRRGFDTVSRDPGRVAARLLKGAAGGDVLLLHDGSAARHRGGAPVVLAALPRVLDELARRGLRAVPLPMPAGAAGAGDGDDRDGNDRDARDGDRGEESS